jgi:tetratricopeptide (TPR) repeat protein
MKNLLLLLFLLITVSATSQDDPFQKGEELFAKNDFKSAAGFYQDAIKKNEKNVMAYIKLAGSYYKMKDFSKSAETLEKALTLRKGPLIAYGLAQSYAQLNEKSKALEALKLATEVGYSNFQQMSTDKEIDPLRETAEFKQLFEKVKLNSMPCAVKPEFRQFEFWIGEWEVKSPEGNFAGNSSIQQILGQCVILENWTGGGGQYTGKSFNFFNSQTGKWQQTWVDDKGGFIEFVDGEYKDGKMVFYSRETEINGKKTIRRLSFFNLEPGKVKQFSEQSTDGGKTWVTEYDLRYFKK